MNEKVSFSNDIIYGMYGNTNVVIKKIACYKTNLLDLENLSIYLWSLKELIHSNFVLFYGAYIEPNQICMVYNRTKRGMLYDVLIQDKEKLDFILLCSLINDLVNGMNYLHNSQFICHGKLSSRCCYVEEPWCLKISEYGMNEIESYTFASFSSSDFNSTNEYSNHLNYNNSTYSNSDVI